MTEPTNPTQHYVPRSHNTAGPPTSRSAVSRDGLVIDEDIHTEKFIDRNVQRHQRASLDRQQQAKSILDSLRDGKGPQNLSVQVSVLDSVRGTSIQNSRHNTPQATPRVPTRPPKKKPTSKNIGEASSQAKSREIVPTLRRSLEGNQHDKKTQITLDGQSLLPSATVVAKHIC